MGDVDGGDAEVLLHLLQLVAQLHAQLCVKVGKRLVHADDGRSRHQRAGDGNALLLAAGELRDGLFELIVGKIHLAGDLAHPAVDLILFRLLDLQAEGDVVIHRHRGKKRIALEHDADAAVLDGNAGDVAVLDHDAAAGRLDKARDGAQGRRFAAAGGSEEGKELALLDMDIDAMQGGEVAELHNDVVEPDHR